MKTLTILSPVLLALCTSVFALPLAHAEKCKLQENCDCKAPGPTLRWEYAYCMEKLGVTDAKEGIDKLNKCSRAAMPSDYQKWSPCTKNQFWRTKICELRNAARGSACMESDDQIPGFIEKGM